jgi:hypothetical protein
LKQLINKVVLIVAMLPIAAFASTFDFSYTFYTGNTVSGSFNGNKNGNYVENISNITLAHNGSKLATAGDYQQTGWDLNAHWWNVNSPVIVSFDGNLNNFFFSAMDTSFVPFNILFGFVNDPGFDNAAFAVGANFIEGDSSNLSLPPNFGYQDSLR